VESRIVSENPNQSEPQPQSDHSVSYPWMARVARMPVRTDLGPSARVVYLVAFAIGIAFLIISVITAYLIDHNFRRFFFGYLANYAFYLSLALGAIFFVLLQHVTKAGWSVNLRRIAECLAATMPMLFVLAIPIAISVLLQNGSLYPWARPADQLAGDPLTLDKRNYLNPAAFIIRLAIYLSLWSWLGLWYWRRSTGQDYSGDPKLTRRMEILSAPALLIYAITLTFGAWDLFMSLDPHWYSTIFGVYYFAGAAVGGFSLLILIVFIINRRGILLRSITREHYHDLGKFLFGFVFFWGYIAFSQYMLIWYGNIPEETGWYRLRGATTVRGDMNAWSIVSLILLFCGLLIPFAGLLSRHVKRRRNLLVFWAAWVLVFHWLDCYWLVMPQYDLTGAFHLGIVEIASLIGLGGILVGSFVYIASLHSLRPIADPRLEESLLFENI